MDPLDLLTMSKAAREVGISRNTLSRAIRNGELEAVKFGERWMYVDRSDLYKWVRSRRVQTWRSSHCAETT